MSCLLGDIGEQSLFIKMNTEGCADLRSMFVPKKLVCSICELLKPVQRHMCKEDGGIVLEEAGWKLIV